MPRVDYDRYEMLGVDMDGEGNENYVRDCDYCGDSFFKGDEVLGIVSPSGEKLIIHEDEDMSLIELLEFLDVYFIRGEVEEVEMILKDH